MGIFYYYGPPLRRQGKLTAPYPELNAYLICACKKLYHTCIPLSSRIVFIAFLQQFHRFDLPPLISILIFALTSAIISACSTSSQLILEYYPLCVHIRAAINARRIQRHLACSHRKAHIVAQQILTLRGAHNKHFPQRVIAPLHLCDDSRVILYRQIVIKHARIKAASGILLCIWLNKLGTYSVWQSRYNFVV